MLTSKDQSKYINNINKDLNFAISIFKFQKEEIMLNPVSASKNNIVALAFVLPQSYVFVLSVFCIMLVPIPLLQTSVLP